MLNGRRLAAIVAASASLSCQTIVLGAPKLPPCYLESDMREAEVDRLRLQYPASYDWIRRMDALCVAWTEAQ